MFVGYVHDDDVGGVALEGSLKGASVSVADTFTEDELATLRCFFFLGGCFQNLVNLYWFLRCPRINYTY